MWKTSAERSRDASVNLYQATDQIRSSCVGTLEHEFSRLC